MKLLYIIGVPGAGKSTVLREALRGVRWYQEGGRVPHVVYQSKCDGGLPLAQLGKIRDGFGGTDALAMSIQPKVVGWLAGEPYPNVVAEGDRLGNDSFFRAVTAADVDLTVVYLAASEELAANRRTVRGSKQDATWLRGRVTKVHRVAEQWANPEWVLDATQSAADLAAKLRTHPVIASVFGG